MARSFHVLAFSMLLLPATAWADVSVSGGPRALTDADRMYLARQLLEKIKPALKAADNKIKEDRGDIDLGNIPEGEQLFFRIRLSNKITLDYQLLAMKQGNSLMISFKDFINAVDFPIAYKADTGTAEGWYIREAKRFELNVKKREVITDHGTFKFSDAIQEQDGDINVPSDELGQWFGFKFKPNVAQLEIKLVSEQKLPIQEQIERRDRSFAETGMEPPSLPLLADEQKMLDYPFVDVYGQTTHTRPGDGSKAVTTSQSNIRTVGDFAKGTLLTQTQVTKDEKVVSVRATYKKESLEPELLGPLKARRFELGDITPIQVPVLERNTNGFGARVTNKDSLRTVTSADTAITGNATPGWDVELYRGDQLLGIQTVAEDGRYTFSKVNLYGSDNTFRVVMYGLQGEMREEEIYIPVDPRRLADAGNAYDFSVVRQDTNTYNKFRSEDDDNGAPAVTALYEMPVGAASAVTTGLVTRQDGGNQVATGIAGLSTTFADALWNFNAAVDNSGEMGGEIIARKDLGQHQLRNETRIATDRFEYREPNQIFAPGRGPNFEREVFGNEFSIDGPLDINLGLKSSYNATLNYGQSSEGEKSITGVTGINASMRPISFSQQLLYNHSDAEPDDRVSALTNLTGAFGRNRVRMTSDFQIKPKAELQTVSAAVNRYISSGMDAEARISRQMTSKLTEFSASMNWDTGYGNISPGISYNTDNDLTAMLQTRVGLAREPRTGSPKLFDLPITSSGGVSAFVFLDKDGDNVFNNEDEPIPDAVVKAPQNGGRETTDEKGQAFFSRMGHLRLTDVYVDPSSLDDPYWIPGYEGASILPREGHVIPMEFPVHMSGEMDGTVYVRGKDGTAFPLRGVSVGLYDKTGKWVLSASSEQDGYYIFSKIPPGSYYLVVDDLNLAKDTSRPLPQPVTIGYEGTTVYANNIYLKQGAVDVPLAVLAGGLPYDADVAKPYEGRNFALNLGQYKSRLAMGLAWFKVRAMSGFTLNGTDLIEKPADSIPRVGQDGYVLRVSVQENSLTGAYKKCSEIARTGNYCAVEILSGGLDQQMASRGDL